jgi:hypothetical protein
LREALLPSYNLGNERVRKLYEALSRDDALVKQEFWDPFTRHVRRRNDVVHRGERITVEDARESIAVVRELLAYLREKLRELPSRMGTNGH